MDPIALTAELDDYTAFTLDQILACRPCWDEADNHRYGELQDMFSARKGRPVTASEIALYDADEDDRLWILVALMPLPRATVLADRLAPDIGLGGGVWQALVTKAHTAAMAAPTHAERETTYEILMESFVEAFVVDHIEHASHGRQDQ